MSSRPTVNLIPPTAPGLLEVGSTLQFTGRATDPDRDLFEHWMEIKNPEGKWSWEPDGDTVAGWTDGALVGDKSLSRKVASFTFPRPGTWVVRTTAADDEAKDQWQISPEFEVSIVGTLPPTDDATIVFNGGAPFTQPVGSKLILGSKELASLVSEGPYQIKFKADDVVTPPVSELWPMDADAVSNRLGPKWDGADAATRPTNPAPTTKHSDIPYARAQNYEFGTPTDKWNNFWSETGNGLVARKTKTDLNSFRIQTYAAYNGVAVSRPNGDLTGFKPDPVHAGYKLTLPFTASCRSQGIECNEALMGNAAGDIWPSGTQTSRGSDDWPYPTCNVGFEITAMALSTSNEILFVVGINPKTGAGKYAVVACEGKWLPSHTMQRTAQPNQGSWSGFNLIGVRDLPFDFPNSVAAAANGSWIGPSQTANQDLGQIDLSKDWVRKSLSFEGEGDDQPWGWIFATKGIAVVTSKVAGKVAVIDLTKFFARVRADYTQASQDGWESILKQEDAGNYPPTFDEDPSIEPVVNAIYDIQGANFVCCVLQHERWSKDYWKAWIAGEDGKLTVLDTSPLLSRYSWEPVGPGGIIASKFIAKNLTHVTLQRFSDWRAGPHMPIDPNTGKNDSAFGSINGIIVTSRGENAHIFIVSVGDQLTEYLRLVDTRAEDVIACTVNERSFIVTSVDFGMKRGRIINWVMNGVSSDSSWFNLPNPPGSTDETNLWYFIGGEPLEFDDDEHPFSVTTANVN
jgi:hypothetical protein